MWLNATDTKLLFVVASAQIIVVVAIAAAANIVVGTVGWSAKYASPSLFSKWL